MCIRGAKVAIVSNFGRFVGKISLDWWGGVVFMCTFTGVICNMVFYGEDYSNRESEGGRR